MAQTYFHGYGRLVDRLAPKPRVAGEWRWILLSVGAAWIVAFLLRLYDLPAWDRSLFLIGGERVLATHDGYLWLAAAKGGRSVVETMMPQFTNVAAAVTGLSLPAAGFWLPALLSGFVGVVTALWGLRLGGLWAGLAAGIVGANIPGFFYRTRLGYYDTDLFILVLPLLAAWALAVLVEKGARTTWFPREVRERPEAGLSIFALAFLAGLTARTANWWHLDLITVNKIIFWLAMGLAIFLAEHRSRGRLLLAFAVFGITAFFGSRELYDISAYLPGVHQSKGLVGYGWLGIPVGAFLAVAARQFDRRAQASSLPLFVGIALLAAMVLVTNQYTPLLKLFSKVMVYLKPVSNAVGTTVAFGGESAVHPPVWPGITQSIVEARSVEWSTVLQRLGPTPWLSVLGILGFLFVMLMRPLAVLLLPFLVMGIAGQKLGIRFTMFGGPAVALGLGVPLAWAVRQLPAALMDRKWVEPTANILIGLLLLAPLAWDYSDLQITPVIDPHHVEALQELGQKAEDGGRIWNWWDYGYATQYYAKRMTVNDGGRHAGRDIYPEALALMTDSFRQSSQVIKYSALHKYDPAAVWDTMDARDVNALLQRMKFEEVVQERTPAQYVVVSWQNIPFLGWISFYGTWDVEKGEGERHQAERVEDFKLDPRGALVFRGNRPPMPLSSVDMLDGGPYKHKDFANKGPHLVYNKTRQDAVLLDDVAYDSVMVQLLVGQPDQGLINKYFELVVEGTPHVRVYRVR